MDGDPWVYLFNILTAGTDDLVGRNNTLFQHARTLGAVRYPIGSIDFAQTDWQAHYGERWPEVLADKQEFDPDTIMAPGLGLF